MKDLLTPRVVVTGVVASILFAAAAALALTGATAPVVGAVVAGALVAVASAGGAAAHVLAPGEPDTEPRQHKGPGLRRRQLVMGTGAGALTVVAAAVAVPAARRSDEAAERLRGTRWREGSRVVGPDGRPVAVDDIAEGELLTVYPEDAVGSVQAQAVLIREHPGRFAPDPERPDWIPDGIAVYSKLCTHMACPVGLYQQPSGTILCPCHQAAFDLLDAGRALQGPARRALPQLPVTITDDGHLVATGGFSDAVGTGFWGRP